MSGSRRDRSTDAVVVGGGAIGCAVAWRLAQRSLGVVVIERDTPGRAATWAAGGMLSPLGETEHDPAFLALVLASMARCSRSVRRQSPSRSREAFRPDRFDASGGLEP
ncbi:MAG: FAD-dependent oxidoreductase [Gemmatimonadota bacterium]|jgi:glycine/D-amino acid oxidase-like deaminating enzyme